MFIIFWHYIYKCNAISNPEEKHVRNEKNPPALAIFLYLNGINPAIIDTIIRVNAFTVVFMILS
ncbi:hypothetical protein A0H76_1412 [Hepatospora eriocheir]|uniref:Uncharacterized protein n=1 Tax=Hepatospora eriocheir TaxID=1081669 RepID=A0A1X0QKW4_9MICR|nr:hypothetical protein A0H76_1412 [Hepatospora eriocheir]